MAEPRIPTAHAELPSIITSLSRAHWGVLAEQGHKAARTLLRALCDSVVDWKTGIGRATKWQIARAAGYRSQETVRTGLNLLEDLGIITWTRGGIVRGKAQPSRFKVIKTRLVELIREARGLKRQAEAEHEQARVERWQRQGIQPWTTSFREREIKADSHGPKTGDLLTSDEGGIHLPSSKQYIPLPDTHPLDVQRLNEAAILAHERVEKPYLFEMREDGALLATASGGGGGSAPSRDVLAQTTPTLAKLLKRNGGKRLGRGRFQGV